MMQVFVSIKNKVKKENEKEAQNFLKSLLIELDWDIELEAPVDQTKHWTHPRRIDILVKDCQYKDLVPMGIEIKYMRGIRKGSIISQALYQILFKYATGTFEGEKLKTICIALYIKDQETAWSSMIIQSTHIFTKGLLAYWGIGYLNLNDNPLRIQFGSDSQNDMKIFIKYYSKYTKSEYRDAYKNKYIPNENKILKNTIKIIE